MENQHRLVMIENEPKYLLSICTPTYNRAELFQKSLDILLPQISKYRDKVSIHISDNASTDNTETMIREMSRKYNVSIDYYHQLENIGLERNYAKAASMTDGKYTFILGDDDLLASNFIKTIIDYIDKDEEYSLIHFNWMHADEKYVTQYIQNSNYPDAIFMSVDKFFKYALASPNFTSSVVFNTKIWELGMSEPGEYDGGGYWGFYRLLKGACIHNRICIYHHYPLVIQRNPIRSFEAMIPYYFWVDMSKIFQMGEKYIPGIYDEYASQIPYFPIEFLSNVQYNVPFYCEHRDEMKEFLSKDQLALYDYIINSRNPKSAYGKWMYKQKWQRRIKRLFKCK